MAGGIRTIGEANSGRIGPPDESIDGRVDGGLFRDLEQRVTFGLCRELFEGAEGTTLGAESTAYALPVKTERARMRWGRILRRSRQLRSQL